MSRFSVQIGFGFGVVARLIELVRACHRFHFGRRLWSDGNAVFPKSVFVILVEALMVCDVHSLPGGGRDRVQCGRDSAEKEDGPENLEGDSDRCETHDL